MHLAGTLDDLGRADEIAQTPPGDGIGLGERIAGDGVLKHAGQTCHTDVLIGCVHDVLVYFVRHHKGVILDGKRCDGFQIDC